MLNYLGSLPTPQGGQSMPQGIPGAGGPMDPTLSPQAALAAPAPSFGGMPMGGMMADPNDPGMAQYSAVTQEDGSILLHLKNPDGSLGPAVKIIPAIKKSGQGPRG